MDLLRRGARLTTACAPPAGCYRIGAMNLRRPLAALTLSPALLLVPVLSGCGRSSTSDAPAIPASSDPEGKDLVEGAVVAAQEKSGGYRLYKIVHVDDYPDPIGYAYHFIAYAPKGTSLADAAKLWKQGAVHVELDHIEVRQVDFMPRDHRVIAVEKVTEAEIAPYNKVRRSYPTPSGSVRAPITTGSPTR